MEGFGVLLVFLIVFASKIPQVGYGYCCTPNQKQHCDWMYIFNSFIATNNAVRCFLLFNVAEDE